MGIFLYCVLILFLYYVYVLLYNQKFVEDFMFVYFVFLIVMFLYVFLKEKVDVVIMEVGIGGQYDSINLVRKFVVCGVFFFGLDYIFIFGEIIDKIVWYKVGIFKVFF